MSDKIKDIIVGSFRFLVKEKRTRIYGFVIMPNHIHLLWTIREPHRPSNVKRDFLKFTSQQIIEQLKRNNDQDWLKQLEVNASDRRHQVWERNPLAIEAYTEEVIMQKLEYIHNNPTKEKWRLSKTPEDYVYSSARFYYLGDKKWEFLTHIRDESE